MPSSGQRATSANQRRRGFTIIEAVMVLLIVATVVGALAPAVTRQMSHARVNRAAYVIAGDFFLSQSLAGRQHSPVVLTVDGAAMTLTVTSRVPTATTLYVRKFGTDSEFKLSTLSSSSGAVEVLPNGTANASATITVGDASYTRQVRMSRAGQIRIL